MANFLTRTTAGIKQLVTAITTSSGVADADKIIATNAQGVIDVSFLPDTQKTVDSTAGEVLTAGDLIYLDGSGTAFIADNTAIATAADGYVNDTVVLGAAVTVYRAGCNDNFTGLTIGAYYYLDTAGDITSTPPAFAVGTICQDVGQAVSATALDFKLNTPIEYANQ